MPLTPAQRAELIADFERVQAASVALADARQSLEVAQRSAKAALVAYERFRLEFRNKWGMGE